MCSTHVVVIFKLVVNSGQLLDDFGLHFWDIFVLMSGSFEVTLGALQCWRHGLVGSRRVLTGWAAGRVDVVDPLVWAAPWHIAFAHPDDISDRY